MGLAGSQEKVGAPFLASFARSGDFGDDPPLRGRLPLELALGFVLLLGMVAARQRDVMMVSRARQEGLGRHKSPLDPAHEKED